MVWLLLWFPLSQMGPRDLATGDFYLTNKVKNGGLSFAVEAQCEVCHVSI
jgi:hypothetical protein